jgi:hypothetical protein
MQRYARLAAMLFVAALAASVSSPTIAVPITGNSGPGGFEETNLASNLQLWLRGDVGVQTAGTVTQWDDQSFFNRDAVPDALANQPSVGTLNARPAVVFTGSGAAATNDRLEFPALSAQTIVIANRHTVNNSGLDGIIGQYGDFGIRGNGASGWRGTTVNGGDFTFPVGSTFHINGTLTENVGIGVSHILSATRSGGTGTIDALGDYYNVGDRPYTGEIGEVVAYDRALNSAERIVLENHLSTKYGIGVTTDLYNDTYSRDLFGVANDGVSTLSNAGMAGMGIEADGTLDAVESILAAHNVAVNSVVDVSNNPDQSGERFDRVWYLDVRDSGNGLGATLAFDFDDAGVSGDYNPGDVFQLLYSDNASFDWEVLSIAGVDNAGKILFTVPDALLESGYYTLGLNVFAVPEPSTAALLVLGLSVLSLRRRKVVA